MVYEEDISIVSNSMNEMIDTFTECRTITCMRYDRHFRMSYLDTRSQWKNAPMKSMDCGQSDLI
jgi:hypothetical protein